VPPSTVLVTRASRFIGGQLAARLAADPVIGREARIQAVLARILPDRALDAVIGRVLR